MKREPDQGDAPKHQDQDKRDLEAAGSLARQCPATHRNALLSAQKGRLGLVIEIEHARVEWRFVEAAQTHRGIADPRFEFVFRGCR